MYRAPYCTTPYHNNYSFPALKKLPAVEKQCEEDEEDEDEEDEEDPDKEYDEGEYDEGEYDEGEYEGEYEGESFGDNKEEGDEKEEEKYSSINKLTLDLMMNHKYLAKTNPARMHEHRDLQMKILKHRKDILKIIQDCFRHLDEGDLEPIGQKHLMDGFEEFAKLALVDIEHAKLPEADELFR